jgi:hypothetical protein
MPSICRPLKTVYTLWMNRDFPAPALLPLPVLASLRLREKASRWWG